MTNTNTTNTADLRAALIEARDWFESQAKAASKGCGSSYELHDLRVQRDALDAALVAPAQDDALTVAYMAGRYDAKKVTRTAAQPVAWAATSEDGDVEALGMNESRRFDTPLYKAPQPPAQAQPPAVVASKLGDICSFRSSVARKGDVVYFQPPAQAQDARQPLTDAEVSLVYFEVLGTVRIQDPTLINRLVRAIDAAHGIK